MSEWMTRVPNRITDQRTSHARFSRSRRRRRFEHHLCARFGSPDAAAWSRILDMGTIKAGISVFAGKQRMPVNFALAPPFNCDGSSMWASMINALLILLIFIVLLLTPSQPVFAHLVFPEDHGPHPSHRIESWYFNGRLATQEGQQFGFHLGFFRLGIWPDPPKKLPQRTSAWTTDEIYRAELGLTDLDGGRFYSYEQISRAALGLAGARTSPIRVWVYDWSVETSSSGSSNSAFRLHAVWGEEMKIDLELEVAKAALIPRNIFPAALRNTTHWYSMTRMTAVGRLLLAGNLYEVEGDAWLDRLWRSSSFAQVSDSLRSGEPGVFLSVGQMAFNRFALQLDDGREFLCFEMHRRDGTGVPIPSGVLIYADGSVRRIAHDELVLSETRHWTSPTEVRYPAGWRIVVPDEQLALEVIPSVADQEIRQSVRYWSGAINITGRAGDRAVAGHGHVALTGYAARHQD